MKLYTFLDSDGRIIYEVRAESHDKAVDLAGVDYSAEFYSDLLPEEVRKQINSECTRG